MGNYANFLVEPRRPSFIGYPQEASMAKVAIIGIPYDAGSTCKPGSRYAPQRVREVSQDLETYDVKRRLDVSDLPVADLGDVMTGLRADAMIRDVSNVVRELNSRGKLVAAIGGDHTVTLGLLHGQGRQLPTVVFDAHLDFRDEYPRGERLSHATVLRRAMEGLSSAAIAVGVRAVSKEEIQALESEDRIIVLSPESSIKDIEDALSVVSSPLHLSIDMDVLDPAYAPGVGCPEPGGLTFSQLLNFIEAVLERRVTSVDIVEANPLIDVNDITSRAVAKILMRCLISLAEYAL